MRAAEVTTAQQTLRKPKGPRNEHPIGDLEIRHFASVLINMKKQSVQETHTHIFFTAEVTTTKLSPTKLLPSMERKLILLRCVRKSTKRKLILLR